MGDYVNKLIEINERLGKERDRYMADVAKLTALLEAKLRRFRGLKLESCAAIAEIETTLKYLSTAENKISQPDKEYE